MKTIVKALLFGATLMGCLTNCSDFLEESSQDEIKPTTVDDLAAVLYINQSLTVCVRRTEGVFELAVYLRAYRVCASAVEAYYGRLVAYRDIERIALSGVAVLR